MGTTTSTSRSSSPENREGHLPHGDALARIIALGTRQAPPEALLRDAATVVAQQFGSPLASVSVRFGARELKDTITLGEESHAEWKRILEGMALEVRTNPRAIGRLYTSQNGQTIAAISAPVFTENSGVAGSIAVVTACGSKDALGACVLELRAVCTAVSTALAASERATATPDTDGRSAAGAIGRASAYSGLTELAFALTNNLRNKLGCDQVIMGVPRQGRVKIVAISGLDSVKPRSPGTAVVREALEETLDERRVVCSQNDDAWQGRSVSTNHRLHRAWHESAGNAAVASIPLFAEDEIVALIGIRRRGGEPFTLDELNKVAELVGPFGTAIPVVTRASRGMLAHALDSLGASVARLFSKRGWGHRLVAVSTACFLAWFVFGSLPYRITVNAVLAPRDVTELAAPFAGVLEYVHAQPGDAVEAGELLCSFDTRELLLQESEAQAELASLSVEIDQALAESDVAAATLASARRDMINSRLAMIQRRIESAEVRAPGNGTVITGDLRERVGQLMPLGERLYRFAPGRSVRLELLTDEANIDEVRAGLTGAFAPTARPGEKQPIVIQRVRPSAEVREGKNVFVAEAMVDSPPDWMRIGMEGVARVEIERRPVWWVALHRVSDFVRLKLWL